ncbi:MAG: hypothetical protein OZSIB_2413 [Candidatus Ozemobacter sibiricus]|uniref:Uncharacterized protein n=1 Tax=Candidatus Ozemobacter sibiricus TaxID=2268124 RepID=A0A367ZSM6_9BACT|nr:MAG: hypothetical protein OZSIB_2413 [Candidatus Ozemobacter sibiricus]
MRRGRSGIGQHGHLERNRGWSSLPPHPSRGSGHRQSGQQPEPAPPIDRGPRQRWRKHRNSKRPGSHVHGCGLSPARRRQRGVEPANFGP